MNDYTIQFSSNGYTWSTHGVQWVYLEYSRHTWNTVVIHGVCLIHSGRRWCAYNILGDWLDGVITATTDLFPPAVNFTTLFSFILHHNFLGYWLSLVSTPVFANWIAQIHFPFSKIFLYLSTNSGSISEKILSHNLCHDGQLTNHATICTQCRIWHERLASSESHLSVLCEYENTLNSNKYIRSTSYHIWMSLQPQLSIPHLSMAGGWVWVIFQNIGVILFIAVA